MTEMNLQINEHVIRIISVTPHERIDAACAPALREKLHNLLDNDTANLVVDLSQVPFMDSAGMAVLVSALKRARQHGGDVKLVWPQSEAAQRILKLTKFDRVFDIANSLDAAVKAF